MNHTNALTTLPRSTRGPRLLTACAIAALMGSGCTTTSTPQADAQFGEATRMLRAQQVVDADAPAKNSQRPVPADGKAAALAQKAYLDSYGKRPTVEPGAK